MWVGIVHKWRTLQELHFFLTYTFSHYLLFWNSAGWLEPLLDRIKRSPTQVPTPSIDEIAEDTLEFIIPEGIQVGGFSWSLEVRYPFWWFFCLSCGKLAKFSEVIFYFCSVVLWEVSKWSSDVRLLFSGKRSMKSFCWTCIFDLQFIFHQSSIVSSRLTYTFVVTAPTLEASWIIIDQFFVLTFILGYVYSNRII